MRVPYRTQLLKGRVPDADAEVLANATHQGLVCLGKTHLTELAFSGLGLNPKTATPPHLKSSKPKPHRPPSKPSKSSSPLPQSLLMREKNSKALFIEKTRTTPKTVSF